MSLNQELHLVSDTATEGERAELSAAGVVTLVAQSLCDPCFEVLFVYHLMGVNAVRLFERRGREDIRRCF